MPGPPRRLNHPVAVYLIGLVFMSITLTVSAAVLYQIALAPEGPAFLLPLHKALVKTEESSILTEVRRQEEYEKHRHFHNVSYTPELPVNLQPVCYICHSDYPHSKNKKVRALLNMHTQFLVCETCHIEEQIGVTIIYKWYNPMQENPSGPFFGTDYDPDSGRLIQVSDHFSRIAPYYLLDGKPVSAIQLQDSDIAMDYMKVRDQLTPEQRDNVKKKFHSKIKPKGDQCQACHVKKGILDFRGLGFSVNRAVDLEELNIRGMLTKYEKFYIPNLFSSDQKESGTRGKSSGKSIILYP